MMPFTIDYHHATPHGVMAAVHLRDSPDPVPQDILELLPPNERVHSETLRGYRQVQFVGGRLALHHACDQLGIPQHDLLPNDRGAVCMPPSFVGSVSHKRTIAVAMVARSTLGTLGIDIEEYGPPRLSIASRILTPQEMKEVEHLPEERQWMAVLLRFSIKESIYKAIDPFVRRYVGFHEAIVHPDVNGTAQVTLNMREGEGPFSLSARYEWIRGRLLTSVRIRPDAIHANHEQPPPIPSTPPTS